MEIASQIGFVLIGGVFAWEGIAHVLQFKSLLNFWRYTGAERDSLRNSFIVNIAVIGGSLLAATSTMG